MAHLRAVAAYLAGDLEAEIAALLRRWNGRRRPAILVVLDWDPPFADVYAEDELLEVFPGAPLIDAGPIDEFGAGRLLIVVIDEEGETAYAIADPKASNRPSGMPDHAASVRPRRSSRRSGERHREQPRPPRGRGTFLGRAHPG